MLDGSEKSDTIIVVYEGYTPCSEKNCAVMKLKKYLLRYYPPGKMTRGCIHECKAYCGFVQVLRLALVTLNHRRYCYDGPHDGSIITWPQL